MATGYATGKYALGECGRSGKVVPLNEMVEDGYIPGMLVAREYYEMPDPTLNYQPVTDAVALERTAPDSHNTKTTITIPNLNTETFLLNGNFFIPAHIAPESHITLSYDVVEFLITEDGNILTDENGNAIILE